MSKARAVSDKPRILNVEQIPQNLGSKLNSFERLRFLTQDGKVAIRYKESGCVLLCSVIDKDPNQQKLLKNPSKILYWAIQRPFLITTHDNNTIQVYDYELGTLFAVLNGEKFCGNGKIQCVLLDDIYIYAITSTQIIKWTRENVNRTPLIYPLKDAKDSNVRVIINIDEAFSSVVNINLLLLGNSDVFQVWKLDEKSSNCLLVFEGRNSDSTAKYLGVYFSRHQNTVLTNSRNSFLLWDISKSKSAASNPLEFSAENVITAVSMDESFIIIGDSNGGITLRQRRDGKLIYQLNQVDSIPQKPQQGSLIDFNLENKINSIRKIGRWVFVLTENSKLQIFDLLQEKAGPILEYVHPKNAILRNLFVQGDSIYFTIKTKNDRIKSKDKGETEKIKPEVGLWIVPTTKLPGLEFFSDALNDVNVNNLTLPLKYTFWKVQQAMEEIEKAGEDTTEFSEVLQRVEDTIRQLSRNNDFEVTFGSLRELYLCMDEYAAMVEQLTQSGRLIRFFTSARLRTKIEAQNSLLHEKLNQVEPQVQKALLEKKEREKRKELGKIRSISLQDFPSNQPVQKEYSGISTNVVSKDYAPPPQTKSLKYNSEYISATIRIDRDDSAATYMSRDVMIIDVEGKQWWKQTFGSVVMVDWKAFIGAMSNKFPGIIGPKEASQLQSILDHSNTSHLSSYKFSEYLKGFGPFQQCVTNTKRLLAQSWFHGFLSSHESELLLRESRQADGTFLVRFSKSKPGSFALAFVQGGGVKHILIESAMPEGLKISEQMSSGSTRVFSNLEDIIAHYKFVLKTPYIDNVSRQPWFHGDLSAEESNELLGEQPIGTFLVRFSSRGCFAVSFVDSSRIIRHVLVTSGGKNNYSVNTGDGIPISFSNIQDLVNYYHQKGVFKMPLKTTNLLH